MKKHLLVLGAAISALTFAVAAYGKIYQANLSAKNVISELNLLETQLSPVDPDRRQIPSN
jgi:hypothetical protein